MEISLLIVIKIKEIKNINANVNKKKIIDVIATYDTTENLENSYYCL